jgi:hypothetical protein
MNVWPYFGSCHVTFQNLHHAVSLWENDSTQLNKNFTGDTKARFFTSQYDKILNKICGFCESLC